MKLSKLEQEFKSTHLNFLAIKNNRLFYGLNILIKIQNLPLNLNQTAINKLRK